jgi:CRP-like cAMP-binding protein
MRDATRSENDDVIAPLLAYMRERMELSAEDAELVRSVAVPRGLARGEYVQRAGDNAVGTLFVAHGLLRSYLIDADGKEHILRFAPEGWWLGDARTAGTGTPSQLFFEALEPSRVALISWSDHDRLLATIPGHAIAFATGIQRLAAVRERWIIGSLSGTAEERYREFVATYPTIVSRVPQHMIASYLGLAPETVSRIRRRIAKGNRGRPSTRG